MAKRAINSGATTPTGYDSGHADPADAFVAGANDDQMSYTEAYNTVSTVNSSLTGIKFGVDTESGTGVADIAHVGSGIFSTSRAGMTYFNATPTFQCTGSCDITWLQFRHYNTIGGNSSAVYANAGGAITCKNVLASVDGSQDFSCFQCRTQTGASGSSSLTLDYCMATVDISSPVWAGEALRVWNHSTAFDATVITRNCTMIGFTDAAGGGQSFDVLRNGTATTVDITSTACQWYGKGAGTVAGINASFTAGASGVGYNASTNSEHGGAIDLGSTRWEGDTGSDWYDLGVGRDLTPKFPSTRAGPDNSANAAKNDASASVDFAGVVIGTFDIGCFDQGGGGGGGGETLNDLETGTLEVWALVSSMNAGVA